MHLGVFKWDTDYWPFSGMMDEVRVFQRRALTQADLSSLMVSPATTDALGLVVALTFDNPSHLGKDSSCRGVGDATNVTAVAAPGKECGSVDSSAVDTCSR